MDSSWSSLRLSIRSSDQLGPRRGASILKSLVESPDVAAAEGQRALTLDQLDEEGAPLMGGSGKYLEHLPPSVPVGEHVEFAQLIDSDGEPAKPSFERLVVPGGGDEELNAARRD